MNQWGIRSGSSEDLRANRREGGILQSGQKEGKGYARKRG
jgi:hypothetical protein